MNILFITAHKYLPQMYGGLQTSTDDLCRALIQRGHRVSVLAGLLPGGAFALKARVKMKINQRLSHCQVTRESGLGYPVWYAWMPWEAVGYVAKRENPDLIVVMAHLPVRMALAAEKTGKPILMQLHDVELDKHGGDFKALGDIACVANSHFTAQKYTQTYGVDCSVIYPFMSLDQYKTTSTRKNVTFINPHLKKGRDIAIGVARLCPDIPFVFVEAWPLTTEERQELCLMLAPLANVTLLPPQKSMRSIYGACRILLTPSLWEEAYGRVASEAQISGIPVVGSRCGGLPEAIGAGGVLVDPSAPHEDWAKAVRDLWQDPFRYDQLSLAALEHASRPEIFFERQIDAWEKAFLEAAKKEISREEKQHSGTSAISARARDTALQNPLPLH